ncbi:MAG: NAD(P)-binding domain-containing protein [Xanthomonadales bacterium]|nr:NAD(P)-binding domain-containing protein [Xanthomonadales bacterium]
MSSSDGPAVVGTVDALIIGAGHSGLAMSRCLSERGIGHAILERGEVAHSWRTERWDSLRLLTPNWQARLPGFSYDGEDRDGFMTMHEVICFVEAYAGLVEAPIHTGTEVTRVSREERGYRVETANGTWLARSVVAASGGFNVPLLPACAGAVPGDIEQFTPHDYRNPGQLPPEGCLVVGASATGLQLAEEIHASGRPVTLSVGEHVRMPRRYRGRDVQFWMDACGLLDERYDEVDDLVRARHVPSPQLVGTPDAKTLDLNVLTDMGVRLAGRLATIRDGRVLFSGGLRNVCALADLKMNRMLNTFDEWVDEQDDDPGEGPRERFAATRVAGTNLLNLDLRHGEIRSIVWATGFRPDYSWLDLPILDRKGVIRHDGGVAESPGLYVLGLNFLRRRKSSFIHGAEDDATDLADHLHAFLGGQAPPAALPA